MKGLIYRWLLSVKRPFTLGMLLLLIGVACAMYIVIDNTAGTVYLEFDSGIPIFLFTCCSTGITMLQLFNDRNNGVEKCFLSTPVSRRKYLLSAYLFYGCVDLFFTLLYVCIFVIAVYSKGGSADISNILLGIAVIWCCTFLLTAMLILSGLSLSRICGIILCLAIFAGFIIFSIISDTQEQSPMLYIMSGLTGLFSSTGIALLISGTLTFTAALSALIGYISIKLYKRRDLK